MTCTITVAAAGFWFADYKDIDTGAGIAIVEVTLLGLFGASWFIETIAARNRAVSASAQ